MLSLRDPQGFPLNLLYGQEPAETGPLPTKLLINSESEKPRVRNFQRFQPGPAAVHKVRRAALSFGPSPLQRLALLSLTSF